MPNTNERSFLGYGYQKSSTGDLLLLGRKKKDKNVIATTSPSASAAIGGGSNLFEQDATALQSDAMSGQIYGGTSAGREEAAGLAGDMGESKGKDLNINTQGALDFGSSLLDSVKSSDKYGNLDIAKDTLKGASEGFQKGGVPGAVIQAGVNLVQGIAKKKDLREAAKEKRQMEMGIRSAKTSIALAGSEAEEFYGKTKEANQGLYGAQDIDNFIEQNRA